MDEKKAQLTIADACSRKELCLLDVRKRLVHWELSPEETNRIITFLLDSQLVDERRYAKAYVHDKFHFYKWGKQKIKMMLHRKQIPDDIVREAAATITPEEDQSACLELMTRKRKSIHDTDPMTIRQKLTRFAFSHGFSYGAIRWGIDKAIASSNPDND